MRASGSTPVISTIRRPAPDIDSAPKCCRCQSLAEPSSALYWHIGETAMRFANSTPPRVMGSNKWLIECPCVSRKTRQLDEGRTGREVMNEIVGVPGCRLRCRLGPHQIARRNDTRRVGLGENTHDLRRFVVRRAGVAAAPHHLLERLLQLEVVYAALRIGLDRFAANTGLVHPQAQLAHYDVAGARVAHYPIELGK